MADLSFDPPQPQDDDSELTIDHKTAVNISRIADAILVGGQDPFDSVHIATNTTTLVKSGAGTLGAISINTKGVGQNTATVYDSLTASGTVLAILDTTEDIKTLVYNISFATGLTIVTATGTAGDLTVSFR